MAASQLVLQSCGRLIHSRLILLLFAAQLACSGAVLGQRSDSSPNRASDRQAISFYTDAANFQNNHAYPLAIEQWKKLLKGFPNDPLAGKAWHYLGICYTQLEEPDYAAAIDAFEHALQTEPLEVREEARFYLSSCLFTQARSAEPGSEEQKKGLERARQTLTEFLKSYADGGHFSQALFYLGEIEYSLGNSRQSIAYFDKLLSDNRLTDSSLQANARYALAIAYEEQQQIPLAKRQFEQFLESHPKHRLATEVRVRLGDILLQQNQPAEAERLLSDSQSTGAESTMADYTLLRLGYALAQQGKQDAAADRYRQLLKGFPNSKHVATAALSLGQILHAQGKYDEAVTQFRSLIDDRDAQAAEAAHWLAITLLKQNRAVEVVELLEEVLPWSAATPTAVSLQMDYADALYAQPEQLLKAQQAYELISTESPEHALAPRATYNAAFAALQGGRLSEARSLAERFLGRYPQDGLRNDVAYIAAESLLLQGEHTAAAKAYAQLRASAAKHPTSLQWTLRQGMAHYLAGDHQSAIDLLQAEFARFEQPDQRAEAQFILGASWLYLEDFPKAIELLSASHKSSERWTSADEVLLLLAEAQQRNRQTAEARNTLQQLLKEYPNTRLKAQVTYKLAQLSAALNEFDEAIAGYRQIVQDESAANYHNFAQYGIAWSLMQQERYQPALDALQPLLDKGSRDSIGHEARLAQGICLRKLGQPAEAITALEQFLRSQPRGMSLGNGLYELGLAYTETGDPERASQQFERILQDVADYPALDKVLYELAWNQQEASDPDAAAKYFKQLADRFPSSEFAAEAMYMLAQQQYESGQFAEAAATYAKVIDANAADELLEKAYYKLGWSQFQQQRFGPAAERFQQQVTQFPTGPLAVDGLFMRAECAFKQDRFDDALLGYRAARKILESSTSSAASEQVRALIYLHAAQCLREQKQWDECEQWLRVVLEQYADSPYVSTAQYELGYCLQNQNKILEALTAYAKVAENYRNEIGARARFMMGEVYFAQRDFAKAIPEFQKVMYGFDAEKAPDDIKNWQAKSAFEAARCSEVLIESQRGRGREKAIETAQEFYNFVVEKHAAHDLAAQAQTRLRELSKLR